MCHVVVPVKVWPYHFMAGYPGLLFCSQRCQDAFTRLLGKVRRNGGFAVLSLPPKKT